MQIRGTTRKFHDWGKLINFFFIFLGWNSWLHTNPLCCHDFWWSSIGWRCLPRRIKNPYLSSIWSQLFIWVPSNRNMNFVDDEQISLIKSLRHILQPKFWNTFNFRNCLAAIYRQLFFYHKKWGNPTTKSKGVFTTAIKKSYWTDRIV